MATAATAEKKASKNAVRGAIQRAVNPPPRACRYLLSLIGHYSDWTTGRNAHPGTMTLARLDGCNERNLRHKLRTLYDGHWIDVQDGPDPGPDRVRFYDTFRTPDRRPTVWRLALETLRARPGQLVHDGSFPACLKCNPKKAKGRVTGVAADRERVSSATGVRVSSATGVRVSLATDLPAVDRLETPPDRPANLAAGVRTDVNGGAGAELEGEVERLMEDLLRHVLTAVQDVTGQTSTPVGDRLALVSLRRLLFPEELFPEGKLDPVDERDQYGTITTRIEEVMNVALWVKERGAKILSKYHRLDVLFSPTEFPSVSSQAESWEESEGGDWRARSKQVIALCKPLDAEVKALVHLVTGV